MGCNYILVYPTTEPVECHCCGHVSQKQKTYHLGKSSAGWCFSLHVSPELGLNTWEDIIVEISCVLTEGGHIEDEYGDKVTLEDFVSIVTNRVWRNGFPERHKIDGWHCIGHGEGTWDYIVGEFS